MRVDIMDDHYMALSAIVTVVMQLLFFAIAFAFQFDKVTDFAGSTNFTLLAWMTLILSGAYQTRQIIVTVMLTFTRAYLAGYLLYRVLQRGHDARFDQMRSQFFAFLGFWVFQMIWAFGVSVPVIYLNSLPVGDGASDEPPLEWRDYLGYVLFGIGCIFEIAGDLTKNSFRADKSNKGKVCDVGVWGWCRHPNYFGEIMIWWGIFVSCTAGFEANGYGEGYGTVVSPILTMLILLFLSGVPSAEGSSWGRYTKNPEYRPVVLEYIESVPPVVPFPSPVYRVLPGWCKAAFCCEFPMYAPPTEKEDEQARAKDRLTKHGGGHGANADRVEGGKDEGEVSVVAPAAAGSSPTA